MKKEKFSLKCTVCGCKDLKKVDIIDNQVVATEGYVKQLVDSYACEKCGHIELYVNDETNKKSYSKPFVCR